jgi:hypothetical protein
MARRPLTISESPMRERLVGTVIAVIDISSGGGSFVTKRTHTWRDGSTSMAASGLASRCGGGGSKRAEHRGVIRLLYRRNYGEVDQRRQ